MSMSYQIDQSSVDNVRAMLGELSNMYKSVMTTSINKTLSTVQTQATARIGNELNLTATRIKQDMTITKANYGNISGKLSCTGGPVGLVQFSPEDTSTGVTVRVLKSKGRSLLKHAYLAPGKKGTGLHVWWRGNRSSLPPATKFPEGQKSHVNWYRIGGEYRGIGGFFAAHPLERLTGPRIEDIFAKDSVFEPVSIQASVVYLNYLDDQIASVFRRFG